MAMNSGPGDGPADDVVVCDVDADGVATVTLNRPDRMNAWNDAMEIRYFDLLDDADADPAVRAIVVTGAGRGFCPGKDMADLAVVSRGPGQDQSWRTRPMTHGLTIRKPMVAAINGGCAGIGLVQALVCDVRFAASGPSWRPRSPAGACLPSSRRRGC
jgi:enoyl-CoA hydratase/carnithine racemase